MPSKNTADAIIEKKLEVLRRISIASCHRYQYQGYADEKGVAPQSGTETYAELELSVDTPRWKGVPFYIRCGKSLNRDGSEIGVKFKPMQKTIFKNTDGLRPNSISFFLKPSIGIVLGITNKNFGVSHPPLTESFIPICFNNQFIPDAYQKLLLDAIQGDHTVFVTTEESKLAWTIVEGVRNKGNVEPYKKNTLPPSHFNVEWMDFEALKLYCPVKTVRAV
jgi:glucose-6-phosphate 1-dehydrogenase